MRKLLYLSLVSIFVLMIGLWTILQLPKTKLYLKTELAAYLSSKLRQPVYIEKLDGVLPWSCEINGLIIGDKIENPWLAADSIILDWAPLSLFQRQIYIEQFSIQNLTLYPENFNQIRSNFSLDSKKALRKMGKSFFEQIDIKIANLDIQTVRVNDHSLALRGHGNWSKGLVRINIETALDGCSIPLILLKLQGSQDEIHWRGLVNWSPNHFSATEDRPVISLESQGSLNASQIREFELIGHLQRSPVWPWLKEPLDFSFRGNSSINQLLQTEFQLINSSSKKELINANGAFNQKTKIFDGNFNFQKLNLSEFSSVDGKIKGYLNLFTTPEQNQGMSCYLSCSRLFLANSELRKIQFEGDSQDLWHSLSGKGKLSIDQAILSSNRETWMIKDVSSLAELSARGISFSRIQCWDLEQGVAEAKGTIIFDSEKEFPLDFKAYLTDFQPFCSTQLTAVLDGEAEIKGSLRTPVIKGDITVSKAKADLLALDLMQIPTIEVVYINDTSPPQKKKSASFCNVLIEQVEVHFADELIITGGGISTKWKGAIQLAGDLAKPTTQGKVYLTKGNVVLLNKKLIFSHGQIYLQSPLENSYINMEGELRAHGVLLQVQLNGPLISPNLNIRSFPSLPLNESLSLILFNKPYKELSPLHALRIAQLALQFNQNSASLLSTLNSTSKTFGLDEINVQLPTPGEEKNSSTSVSIGKYLTENLFIGVEQGIGEDQSSGIKLESPLTENLDLELGLHTRDDNRLKLRWKKDY